MNEHDTNALLSWRAPEYDIRKHSKDWFLALWIIAGAGAIASFILKNFTFAILLLLIAFVISIITKRPPKLLPTTISEEGIVFGSNRYTFERIKGFVVEKKDTTVGTIFIELKSSIMPVVTIPIREVTPEQVDELLLLFIPRKHIEESLFEKIAHYFGI